MSWERCRVLGISVVEERAMKDQTMAKSMVATWQSETVNELTPLVGVVDACRGGGAFASYPPPSRQPEAAGAGAAAQTGPSRGAECPRA